MKLTVDDLAVFSGRPHFHYIIRLALGEGAAIRRRLCGIGGPKPAAIMETNRQ